MENNKDTTIQNIIDSYQTKEGKQFNYSILVAEKASDAFDTNICSETIDPLIDELQEYVNVLDDENLKRKYNGYLVDLCKYGIETSKFYNKAKCVPILRELKNLQKPIAKIQF